MGRNHGELLRGVDRGILMPSMQGGLERGHARLPGCRAVRRTWSGAHVLLK